MARIVKKKKRNFWYAAILVLLIIFKLASTIILSSLSNQYTTSIQEKENQIQDLIAENNRLSIEIQTLQNKDRIYTIANDNGMSLQQNVVSIVSN